MKVYNLATYINSWKFKILFTFVNLILPEDNCLPSLFSEILYCNTLLHVTVIMYWLFLSTTYSKYNYFCVTVCGWRVWQRQFQFSSLKYCMSGVRPISHWCDFGSPWAKERSRRVATKSHSALTSQSVMRNRQTATKEGRQEKNERNTRTQQQKTISVREESGEKRIKEK